MLTLASAVASDYFSLTKQFSVGEYPARQSPLLWAVIQGFRIIAFSGSTIFDMCLPTTLSLDIRRHVEKAPHLLTSSAVKWHILSVHIPLVGKSRMLLPLLSHFSRVQLLATPWAAAYQAPSSMGFSRQEYWSGVPLPSPKSHATSLPLLPPWGGGKQERKSSPLGSWSINNFTLRQRVTNSCWAAVFALHGLAFLYFPLSETLLLRSPGWKQWRQISWRILENLMEGQT